MAGTAAIGEQVTAPRIPAEAFVSSEAQSLHEVHLRVDGNVSGRVSRFDASGRLRPARAGVHFLRGGVIATSTRSDERGHFQATGLTPGVYSVIAVGREGFGVRSVVVRPFDESAEARATASQVGFTRGTSPSLDMTLVPAEQFELLAGKLNEELVNVAFAEPAPPAAGATSSGAVGGGLGGGLGGGAGGLGTVLGAAGLGVGITSLSTQEHDHASPFVP